MYLSRIKLDITKRAVLIALSTPSMFHGAVECAFSGERAHALWRIDQLRGERYLLILSQNIPELEKLEEEYGVEGSGETKLYDKLLERISRDDSWNFRLCANPTYSVSQSGKGRGRVCAHTTIENQRSWLLKQSEKNGFRLEEDSFDVANSKWYHFGKAKNEKVSVLSVTYEGKLTVTDEEQFRQCLVQGIGRGKAYGMGLMTIVKSDKGSV